MPRYTVRRARFLRVWQTCECEVDADNEQEAIEKTGEDIGSDDWIDDERQVREDDEPVVTLIPNPG